MIGNLFNAGTMRAQGGLTVDKQVRSLTGWVHVAVNARAEGMAQVPMSSYQRQGRKWVEIEDSVDPLTALLENPNDLETRFEFWAHTVTYLDLTGNCLWLKLRERVSNKADRRNGRNKVAQLWILPSQFVTPLVDTRGMLTGYEMANGEGGTFPIPIEDVVHHRYTNPENPLWGLGRLQAAAAAMKSQDAIKSAQLSAFNNDILSTLYFTCKEALTTTQWKRMLALLRQRYAGVKRAGTPMLLENGVTVGNVNRSPHEMAFRESSQDARDEILSIFQVPPIIAGIVENANRSNSEAQETTFQRYALQPLCKRIAERINKDLAPEFSDDLAVEFENPVTLDRQIEAAEDRKDVAAGVKTPDEIREERGDPTPTEWGAVPRWYAELQFRAKQAEGSAKVQAAAAAKAEADPSAGDPPPVSQVDDAQRNLQAGRPSLTREHGRRPTALRAFLVRSIRQDYDRLEGETIPTLRKFFAKQSDRIKSRLEEVFGHELPPAERAVVSQAQRIYCVTDGGIYARLFLDGTTVEELGAPNNTPRLGRFVTPPGRCYSNGEWSQVQLRKIAVEFADNLDDWRAAADQLAERMLPRLEAAMQAGAETQLAGLDADSDSAFDLSDRRAQDWLRGKERDYWQGTVNATTKAMLSERLAEVLAEGATVKKLADAVEEVMAGRIKSSAEVIARTEVVGAFNASADMVRESLAVTQKEWLRTYDGRTRATHVAAGGQIVHQAGFFLVGGHQLRYPGDPEGPVREIVQCRCAAIAVIGDGTEDD